MNKTHHWILISLIFLGTSCVSVKDLELKEVKGFEVHKLDVKGMDSELLLSIYNPNKYGFKLYPSEFDVSYSGVYLGKAKLANSMHIKGKEEHTYNFLLKNDFTKVNFLEVFSLLKPGGFKNEIWVKGELKAGTFWFRKKFKVDYREKIELQ